MLLDFARPHAPELDAAENAHLEHHLAGCDDCRELSQRERHFDEAVGKAMRAVEVPERLRTHLLNKLEAERNDYYRGWYGFAFRVAAAVLLLVLGAWAVFFWHEQRLPEVNAVAFYEEVKQLSFSPQTPEQVEEQFRNIKADIVAPRGLNYLYLIDVQAVELKKKDKVPLLTFLRNDEELGIHGYARVLILSKDKFNLTNLRPEDFSDGAYPFKLQVRYEQDPKDAKCAYLIVYTGDSLAWLEEPTR
jgi:hypothetical protein